MSENMGDMADRAARMVDSIAGAFFSAGEAAAEKVELATRVARVNVRMDAFGAVLETIGVRKAALMERQQTASGPLARLIEKQIEMLTVEETALLEKAGVVVAEPERQPINRIGSRATRKALAADPLGLKGANGDGARTDAEPGF